jgi:hypothetical protein
MTMNMKLKSLIIAGTATLSVLAAALFAQQEVDRESLELTYNIPASPCEFDSLHLTLGQSGNHLFISDAGLSNRGSFENIVKIRIKGTNDRPQWNILFTAENGGVLKHEDTGVPLTNRNGQPVRLAAEVRLGVALSRSNLAVGNNGWLIDPSGQIQSTFAGALGRADFSDAICGETIPQFEIRGGVGALEADVNGEHNVPGVYSETLRFTFGPPF